MGKQSYILIKNPRTVRLVEALANHWGDSSKARTVDRMVEQTVTRLIGDGQLPADVGVTKQPEELPAGSGP